MQKRDKEPKPHGADLSAVEQLKTLVWFRRVQAIAGCAVKDMPRIVIPSSDFAETDQEERVNADGKGKPEQSEASNSEQTHDGVTDPDEVQEQDASPASEPDSAKFERTRSGWLDKAAAANEITFPREDAASFVSSLARRSTQVTAPKEEYRRDASVHANLYRAASSARAPQRNVLSDSSGEIRGAYWLYAQAKRQPSPKTLKIIENATVFKNSSPRPFEGTAELFLRGPGGAPLWDVLTGSSDSRIAMVNGLFQEEFGKAKLLNSSLPDKFDYLKSQLYDIDQLGKVNEYIRTSQLVPYRHLMERHMLIGAAGIAPPAFRNLRRGARFDMDSVVAAVALAYAAYELKSDIATADFLMVDAFYVLRAKMPEIHDELTEYFLAETTRLSNGLFGIDQLADPLKYSKADDETKELLAPLFIEKGKI